MLNNKIDYCEETLWEIIESGLTSESTHGLSYASYIAGLAQQGTLEKGRGVLVWSSPVNAAKSWFQAIEAKIRKGQATELGELLKVSYMSVGEWQQTFGEYSEGECNALITSYDPLKEFVFIRLYVTTGTKGDCVLLWDPVAFEEPSPDWTAKAKAKLAPAPVVVVPTDVSLPEAIQLLKECLSLEDNDRNALAQGALALSEIPALLDRQLCAQCRKKRENNMACGGCQVVKYCGRDCQVNHWKESHKTKCKTLKVAKDKFIK